MAARTQCWSIINGIAFVGLLSMTGFIGCEQQGPTMDAKKESPLVSSVSESAPGKAIPAPEGESHLLVPPVSSPSRIATDKGINHAHQGHWDVAESHFQTAVEADPDLAETHFNLGLALAKLGKHDEATIAFEKAAELAPGDSRITEPPVMRSGEEIKSESIRSGDVKG